MGKLVTIVSVTFVVALGEMLLADSRVWAQTPDLSSTSMPALGKSIQLKEFKRSCAQRRPIAGGNVASDARRADKGAC